MNIKSIKLLGFRNYLEANLEFNSAKTIILGQNAQGKSNLLEVIQILTHLKSRRAGKDAELINFDLSEAVIHAEAINKFQNVIDISLLIRKSGRRTLKINHVSKKPKELLHNIYSVSFMVDDLEIVTGSPSKRRDWIDSVMVQLSKDYKDTLAIFEKALSQRNAYFKELAEDEIYSYNQMSRDQKEQMAIWDEMFIAAANQLSQEREQFILSLAPIADRYYREISGADAELQINYQGKQIDQDDLDDLRARDFARSYTNIGPQRDDIEFLLKGSLAGSFASQGERRTITLSIKLAELELMKEKHGEYPILLLDDVLAELDENRQDYLLDSISEETQVIITTTHLGVHLEKWSDNAQIIEVENGVIKVPDYA